MWWSVFKIWIEVSHSNLSNTTFSTDEKYENPNQKTTIISLQSSDTKYEVHFLSVASVVLSVDCETSNSNLESYLLSM